MFMLRIAIVLCIVALFLPSSPEEKQRVYTGVSEAVENVRTFCVRNAAFCENTSMMANAVAQRVYYGAQLVYEAALGAPSDQQEWDRERPYPSQDDMRAPRRESRTNAEPARSSNTLRRDDLAPDWRGPDA
jgi:hypothetical protein